MKVLPISQPPESSPEQVFAAKYDWLFKWALHFAQGDRSTAEDLVQDTYVRFVMSCPEVEDPEKAEPLLYTYLKYVHLSHLRRLQRYPHEHLSLVEFDSLEIGLRANPSADLIEMQDDLRRIIAYLAWRKESTKAASILILRFLHGYYPDEIMRIAQLRRARVDNSMTSAREEVKSHLENPGKVVSFEAGGMPKIAGSRSAVPVDRLMEELRLMLWRSRRGECLPAADLRRRYESSSEPIPCELLAHIVSCPRCLEIASSDRRVSPLNSTKIATGLRKVSGGNSSFRHTSRDRGAGQVLSMAQRRLREAMEHRPRRLAVVVNGHLLAMQSVTSAESLLEVEVGAAEALECIEVISEQGLCLMTVAVAGGPPSLPPEVVQEIQLSAGRRIELRLNFTSLYPQIWMTYSDPTWMPLGEAGIDGQESSGATDSRAVVEKNRAGFLGRIASLWRQKTNDIRHFFHLHMSPTLATAVALAIASIFFFAVWYGQRVPVTSAEFLKRAEMWDAGMQRSNLAGVIYQRIEIRTRKQTVQRTLYRDAQGVRRPKQKHLDSAEESLSMKLASAGVNWEDPLSAGSYRDWHDRAVGERDELCRGAAGLLTLTSTAAEGPIAQESLTVREADYHPMGRSVQFRNGETVEIAELNYAVLPWGEVNEDWFEPLPSVSRTGVKAPHATAVALPPIPLTESQLDEGELSARLALSDLHLDGDARLHIARAANGVRVEGVVGSVEQRHELEARLHQAKYVVSAVASEEELSRQPDSNEVVSVKQSSDVAQASLLESFLKARGMRREEIADLSQQLLNAAIQVNQRSRLIHDLDRRFNSQEQMNETTRQLLGELMEEQKEKLLRSLDEEDHALDAMGIDPAVAGAADSQPDELAALGERNYSLCRQVASGGITDEASLPGLASSIRRDVALLRETMRAVQQAEHPSGNGHSAELQRQENR